MTRLAAFPTPRLTSSPSPSMRSSSTSDPPLLCRVLRFLGGSLGSDSPRFRVTGALERLCGRVVRGAMVVEGRDERWWWEKNDTSTMGRGCQSHPDLEGRPW